MVLSCSVTLDACGSSRAIIAAVQLPRCISTFVFFCSHTRSCSVEHSNTVLPSCKKGCRNENIRTKEKKMWNLQINIKDYMRTHWECFLEYSTRTHSAFLHLVYFHCASSSVWGGCCTYTSTACLAWGFLADTFLLPQGVKAELPA